MGINKSVKNIDEPDLWELYKLHSETFEAQARAGAEITKAISLQDGMDRQEFIKLVKKIEAKRQGFVVRVGMLEAEIDDRETEENIRGNPAEIVGRLGYKSEYEHKRMTDAFVHKDKEGFEAFRERKKLTEARIRDINRVIAQKNGMEMEEN